MGWPVRWCMTPSSSMIAVPLATLLPSTPETPISAIQGSRISRGKPLGYRVSPS